MRNIFISTYIMRSKESTLWGIGSAILLGAINYAIAKARKLS